MSGPMRRSTDTAEEDLANLSSGQTPGVTVYHTKSESQLHKIADDSHQDHKAATGQVPDEDQGYTSYEHQGAYAKPKDE